MARIGIMEPFNLDSGELWSQYVERLERFFVANDIGVAKQRAVLLSGIAIRAAGYKLLQNLCCPEKPTDKTYAVVVELMQTHLSPRPSEIVERFTK